jgi:hypothetical protein
MFFPSNTAKVLMLPGSVMGETNGLYASVTVNTAAPPGLGMLQMLGPRMGPGHGHSVRSKALIRDRTGATLDWRGTKSK